MPKHPGGRPPYDPTEKDQRFVEAMAACGFPQDEIAAAVGIAPKTLRLHFREILSASTIKANAKVAATLFSLATSGQCPAATFFWMKCRVGWREVQRIEHSGVDGAPITLDILDKLRGNGE